MICQYCFVLIENAKGKRKYCSFFCNSSAKASIVTTTDFWESLDYKSKPGCWLWQRAKDKDGYGVFRFRKKKIMAHQHAHKIAIGAAGAGMYYLHTCDTPSCCRPGHIYAGTPKRNVDDMRARNRPRGIYSITESERSRIRLASIASVEEARARGLRFASKYLGAWRKRDRWGSGIRLAGRVYNLGSFETDVAASIAYCHKYKELIGVWPTPKEGKVLPFEVE